MISSLGVRGRAVLWLVYTESGMLKVAVPYQRRAADLGGMEGVDGGDWPGLDPRWRELELQKPLPQREAIHPAVTQAVKKGRYLAAGVFYCHIFKRVTVIGRSSVSLS